MNAGAKRLGDCFLINSYCEELADGAAPIDTVRGLFQEGAPLIERGLLNPDGSPRLPDGDPCVTLVR